MSLSLPDLDFVREVVLADSAIVLDRDKAYLVESRLGPLATRLGHASLTHLVAALRTQPQAPLRRQVVDAMTTNETLFFRDVHPFDTLRKVLLPDLATRRAGKRTLHIWCAACSTGQEPYSVALTLREYFPQLRDWRVDLIATDLSRDILERAKAGCFSQIEMNRGLPATLMVKYFVKLETSWRIREDIRAMVSFQELNLARPFPPLPTFDLIFLRNVLIYFDIETKKAILSRMRKVLAPDGHLFLGTAETMFSLDDSFESVVNGKTTCYRPKAEAAQTAGWRQAA